MDLEGMIDSIETSNKENVWFLIEAELNAITRFKMRQLFFQALHEMKEHFDLPKDKWEE